MHRCITSTHVHIDAQIEENRRKVEEALWHLHTIRELPQPEYKEIADENWMAAWKDHYHPIPIGKRLLIRMNGHAEAGALRAAMQPFVCRGEPESAAIPVVVEYGNADARCAVELGADWRVRPQDDLFAEVRRQAGAAAVAVEY